MVNTINVSFMPSRSGTAGVPYSLVVLMVVAAESIVTAMADFMVQA